MVLLAGVTQVQQLFLGQSRNKCHEVMMKSISMLFTVVWCSQDQERRLALNISRNSFIERQEHGNKRPVCGLVADHSRWKCISDKHTSVINSSTTLSVLSWKEPTELVVVEDNCWYLPHWRWLRTGYETLFGDRLYFLLLLQSSCSFEYLRWQGMMDHGTR